MSESKKYQPTASIKRSKFKPRTVTAKGKTYQVTQYGITKENFLKLCRELKEFGLGNVKYINFDVWEAVTDDLNTVPDPSASSPKFEEIKTDDDLPF